MAATQSDMARPGSSGNASCLNTAVGRRLRKYCDTRSPTSPWPSRAARKRAPVASSSSMMIESWFFFRGLYGAYPFFDTPAYVATALLLRPPAASASASLSARPSIAELSLTTLSRLRCLRSGGARARPSAFPSSWGFFEPAPFGDSMYAPAASAWSEVRPFILGFSAAMLALAALSACYGVLESRGNVRRVDIRCALPWSAAKVGLVAQSSLPVFFPTAPPPPRKGLLRSLVFAPAPLTPPATRSGPRIRPPRPDSPCAAAPPSAASPSCPGTSSDPG